jgi:hypothetical protein
VLDAAEGVALGALPATNFTAGTVAACGSSSRSAVLLLRAAGTRRLDGLLPATLQTADGRLLRFVAPTCAYDAARVDACGVAGDPSTLLLSSAAQHDVGAELLQSAALPGTFLRISEPPLRLAGATLVEAEATPLRRRVTTMMMTAPNLNAFAAARIPHGAALNLAAAAQRADKRVRATLPVASPPLSPAQLSAFDRDGYIVLQGVVPPAALQAARQEAAAHLQAAKPVQDDAARFGSDHPALCGLYNATRACGAAAQLLGGDAAPVTGTQISAVAPQPLPAAKGTHADVAVRLTDLARDPDTRWHVDGMDESRDVLGFALLVLCALTDTLRPEAYDGQLTVFPGSQAEVGRLLATRGVARLCDERPRPRLAAQPRQLRLAAGDVVLAHPLLAHRRGVNFAADVRLATVFRVQRVDHHAWRAAQLAALAATVGAQL